MPSLMKMMAEMGLNISPFQAGMKQAEKAAAHGAENIGHHIKGLVAGYFGFHALQHAILGVAEKAVKIGEMAKQFSVTTDEVQKLGIAAEHIGLDFEQVAAGLDKLGAARQSAMEGNERLIYIFNKLGVGTLATDLEKISNLELAKKLGEAFSKMEVTSETREFLRELMGRGGPRLLEALKGIEHTDHETLISKEDIENIHEAEIALKGLQRQWAATIAPAEGNAAQFWNSVVKDTEHAHGALGKYAAAFKSYWQNIFGLTGDENKHVENALQKVARMSPNQNLDLMEWVRTGMMPGEQGPAEKPADAEKLTSPKAITEMLKAQFDLQRKMESIAFSRADKEGKISILQKEITDSRESELRLKQQLNAELISQEEYEKHIAEQKIDQLEAEQKIYELRRQSSIGFEGFRKLARAGGLNPATYGAALPTRVGGVSEYGKAMLDYVSVLKDIERNTGRRVMFLGR